MSTSRKFSNLEIFKAFITRNPEALRTNGYNPESLYVSSEQSFAENEKIRGRIQCRVMTRFTPEESEAPIYEKSGDLLFKHHLDKQARNHWQIAFDHDHKPFDMTMALGQQSLKQGYLPQACTAFDYLAKQQPQIPYVHNELGVAKFMLATQQKDARTFATHRFDALTSFDNALELQPDSIAAQNKKVASVLTSAPDYHNPYNHLVFQPKSSTRMIDALMQDFSQHTTKSESSTGVGITPVTHSDGSASIEPVFTTTSYSVPVVSDQLALYELQKIKQEQLTEEVQSQRRMQVS